MSWTHSSKILAVGVLLAIALGMAGTAAAVTFTEDNVPDEMEVGDQETVTVSIDEPFDDQTPGWELEAETEFDDGTVTITAETPEQTYTESGEGEASLTLDDSAINQVEIEASGEVPEIDNYDYENPEEENFVALSTSADGVFLQEWSIHRFTEESKDARQKIDNAIDRVGEDDDRIDSVIALYDGSDFEQASADAEGIVDEADSEQQTQQLLLYGGAVIVLIALAGGGYYAYSQRKQDTNKLQ